MTLTVLWSRDALDDLRAQIRHIARDSSDAALRVAQRISESASTLGQRPTGRPGRVPGTYEKSVRGLPYVIAYVLIAGQRVAILRVIHTARDWPDGGWPSD